MNQKMAGTDAKDFALNKAMNGISGREKSVVKLMRYSV